jgi:hypothetical protein
MLAHATGELLMDLMNGYTELVRKEVALLMKRPTPTLLAVQNREKDFALT